MHRMIRVSRALVVAAVLSVPLPSSVWAQGVTTGAITGTVTDAQGQPVHLAEIHITHRGTGYVTTGRTRPNGLYLVQGLEVGGPYTVVIRAIGFQPFTQDGISVQLSQATRVDAQLIAQSAQSGHTGRLIGEWGT